MIKTKNKVLSLAFLIACIGFTIWAVFFVVQNIRNKPVPAIDSSKYYGNKAQKHADSARLFEYLKIESREKFNNSLPVDTAELNRLRAKYRTEVRERIARQPDSVRSTQTSRP